MATAFRRRCTLTSVAMVNLAIVSLFQLHTVALASYRLHGMENGLI
jgi:hypothetical protein